MAGLVDAAQAVVAAVWPQREDFETGRFYGWRISIALMALTVTGVLIVVVRSLGLATLLGASVLSGFAQAGEVKDLKDQQVLLAQKVETRANDIMAVVIGGQIFELRTKECAARKAHNDDAAAAYGQQRQSQMDVYQQIAKRRYPMEACP